MPATRASSRQDSQQPQIRPYGTRRAGSSSNSKDTKKTPNPPSNEIIVLSSDDDEPPSKGTLLSKKKSGRSTKKKAVSSAPVNLSDVLEISSDEESHSKKPSPREGACSSEVTNKDRTIKRLQEELKRAEQLIASTSLELEEIKRSSNQEFLSGLDEYTSCGVCTTTMWHPYTLPQCGHSFCESCLADWFSTIQAQHMTANPQLDDHRVALAGHLETLAQMVPNLHAYGSHGQVHLRAVLAELRRQRPEYTCPSCRKEVLNKPVEDFRLKELIREIANRLGETNPRKNPSSVRDFGPFDNFFAAPIPVT